MEPNLSSIESGCPRSPWSSETGREVSLVTDILRAGWDPGGCEWSSSPQLLGPRDVVCQSDPYKEGEELGGGGVGRENVTERSRASATISTQGQDSTCPLPAPSRENGSCEQERRMCQKFRNADEWGLSHTTVLPSTSIIREASAPSPPPGPSPAERHQIQQGQDF